MTQTSPTPEIKKELSWPDRVRLIFLVLQFLLKFYEYVERRGGEAFLRELEAGFDKWDAAKTPEEKREANRTLAELYFDS